MWLAAVGPGATILVLAPGLSTRWAQISIIVCPHIIKPYRLCDIKGYGSSRVAV